MSAPQHRDHKFTGRRPEPRVSRFASVVDPERREGDEN